MVLNMVHNTKLHAASKMGKTIVNESMAAPFRSCSFGFAPYKGITQEGRGWLTVVWENADRESFDSVEYDSAGGLGEQLESGDPLLNLRLENQSAEVSGVELVMSGGIKNDRGLVAHLNCQLSLFDRQGVRCVKFI